jgi:mannose-6-phosphate isomerase-like protein (cupin superfamily)
MSAPPFPGAIGISHLRVYDSPAPDGLRGGTPHVHTVCTEAYVVVAGRGAVQTLGPRGFRELPLERGALVWFTPGTIHRLVNGDGALEIFVLMQNAGLPEAGDMVITFASELLDDPAAYAAAATLPEGERTSSGSGTAARARRDLGVEGFLGLRAGLAQEGPGALARFYGQAARLVAPRVPAWRELVERGPAAALRATEAQLAALARDGGTHLSDASVHALPPPPDERRMGCCGTLGVYVGDAAVAGAAVAPLLAAAPA